jgi:serine protease AprX
VFTRAKTYARFTPPSFNYRIETTWGAPQRFTVDYSPQPPGPESGNTHRFTVAPGTGILDVRIDGGTNAATAETGNALGLMLYAPDGRTYNSGIALPILNAPRREIIVRHPLPGEWVAEVRGLRGLAAVPEASSPVGIAVPERIDGVVHQAAVTAADVPDIAGHAAEAQIREALLTRHVDILSDGGFHPDRTVSRFDFARQLTFNTAVRQSLADTPLFTDLGGGQRGIVESVTANGSTLRDHGFDVAGMMGPSSGRFNPAGTLRRVDLAVALVRALGLDAAAQARGADGYLQIALEKGLLQDVDGEPQPGGTVTRAQMAAAFAAFRAHFVAP